MLHSTPSSFSQTVSSDARFYPSHSVSTQEQADSVVVLDFETTGLSPTQGDRPIEIGAVLIENGVITDRFQRLMNPGFRVPSFIERYTGISNAMVRNAPDCGSVMAEFTEFLGDRNLVAHNAAFDRKFLDAELAVIGRTYPGDVACSVLISRRLYQDAPSHRLSELVAFKNIPTDGIFHRALADAEMTAKLWLTMLDDVGDRYPLPNISFKLMKKISRTPKAKVHDFLHRQCQR